MTTSAPPRRAAPAARRRPSAERLDGGRGGPQRVAAVDPAHLDEVDLVAGGGHQLGLDPLARAEEGDLGAASPKLVGDRHGGHHVTGGSPRGHHHSDGVLALLDRLLPRAGARPPSTTRSLPARGGPPARDVEDQPDREQRRQQAAVAVGDERQRHAGQRRQAHHREEVDRRLDEDQRGQARRRAACRSCPWLSWRPAGRRSRRARRGRRRRRSRPGRAPRRSPPRSCRCGPRAGRRPSARRCRCRPRRSRPSRARSSPARPGSRRRRRRRRG